MTSKPSLNNPIVIQKQIRENATEVQNFLSDLSNWSTEMKAKELAESPSADLTPVENIPLRNDPNGPNPKKSKPNETETPQMKNGNNGKKSQTCDYSGWEKFDAEKACEEVESSRTPKAESLDEVARRRAIELKLQKLANDKKDLGNQCLKEKNYATAIEYYSEGISCDKKSAVLYGNRAQAYMFLKQYQKAIDDCTESIKNDATYIKSYFRRAKASFEIGKLHEAYNDLNQALKLEPKNLEAKQLLNAISRKTMESLLGPTPPPSAKSYIIPPPGRNTDPKNSPVFPGIQTKLLSQNTNHLDRSSDRYMDDDDEDQDLGGGAQAEEQYPKSFNPIIKPIERCSKRPLLPIHVKIVGEEGKRMRLDYNGNEGSNSSNSTNSCSSSVSASNTSSGMNTPVVVPSSPMNPLTDASNVSNSNSNSTSLSLSLASPQGSLPSLFSQLKMTTIPSKAKTAAQFTIDWKKLKAYPDMCSNYLKQMNADDYLIFQGSMEYSILTDILDLLVWEFMPPKWDFVTHLKGLLKVKRFSTLVMFMTEKDRANARKLISECPEQVQEELRAKYNV